MRFPAGSAIAIALFTTTALAQENFDNVELRTTDLGGGLYMFQPLEGEAMVGGNVMIAAGGDGVILVDSNFAPMHDKIVAAVAAVTDQPIRYLISTHHHGDHTGGNPAFAADGVTIVSHERMRDLLAEGTRNGLTGVETPAAAEGTLPAMTYGESMVVEVAGQRAELHHPVDVHTGGDTYVVFPAANVLVTGDIVAFNRYPNIDFTTGGHIDRMIAMVDRLIEMAGADTKIVPGHGPPGSRADLIAYREMMATSRARVRRQMDAGMSEDEIVAMRPNADYDAAFNMEEQRIVNWVRVIYRSYRPD